VYEFEKNDKNKQLADNLQDGTKDPLTNLSMGISDRMLLVPSFKTTAKVFG